MTLTFPDLANPVSLSPFQSSNRNLVFLYHHLYSQSYFVLYHSTLLLPSGQPKFSTNNVKVSTWFRTFSTPIIFFFSFARFHFFFFQNFINIFTEILNFIQKLSHFNYLFLNMIWQFLAILLVVAAQGNDTFLIADFYI